MATTRAIIDLGCFRRNIGKISAHVGKGVLICLPVKADAYGHGAIKIARAAESEGIRWFAIATAEEALELRVAGITSRLLLLGVALPGEIEELVTQEVRCTVADQSTVMACCDAARKAGRDCKVHLAVDTGMGRLGCRPEEVAGLVESILGHPELELEGIYTHLAAAESDIEYTHEQIDRFHACIDPLDFGNAGPILHAENSAGMVGYENGRLDMVRPGIIAYGYAPGESGPIQVEPVMELVSKVVFLKRVPAGTTISYGRTYTTRESTIIATVAAGYGDGYSRSLSNRGEVAIRGRRYRVAGRICMDQFMVDLGPVTDVSLYDEVVLFGPAAPAPTASELADMIGTIPYEVTCNVAKRVPRIYRTSLPNTS